MGKILAIDYGERRIGIAISDENQRMALPIKTILAEKSLEQTAKKVLTELSDRKPELEKIVLGFPLLMNGKESPMCLQVRQFQSFLIKLFEIPVELFDERLTSKAMETSLKEIKVSRKKRQKTLDSLSASLVLQNYLDTLQV